jgi:hypothetical protein
LKQEKSRLIDLKILRNAYRNELNALIPIENLFTDTIESDQSTNNKKRKREKDSIIIILTP